MNNYHTPVLLEEAIEFLKVDSGSVVIDATLGGGGHTGRILEKGAIVLGIDQDPEAIAYVNNLFEDFIKKKKLILAEGNFSDISKIANENGFGQVSGVLYDLGVSERQLTDLNRGFSINSDADLDMRMNPNLSVMAKDLVNGLTEKELAQLFLEYGEEKMSRKIARDIVNARKSEKISTCKQLADIILKSKVRLSGLGKIHPATQCFQALRIIVNNELDNLKISLPQAASLLKAGGRLVVVSFHSLEDRIVKGYGLSEMRLKKITDKPVMAKEEELLNNPKSRSAKLRAYEKTG
ncbi:16S rRNA (cytosine(1402)-N(4))-methyltransferase [candidate division WWE3 bacterium CG08_land_8_20_14_0_20_41_15]|uniref:Ribosomal RNA small subunit methyltransferase H n=1 Tax=candidate division WWE3 bacterium CG08_land_8_20_14_0_20_41_15 TaxID=1975086 RepID=A0A2H0X9Q4_UNCKA|nr:MAG: 16S rRNA (cytosine(1402)-N(4))-methyltransferase [candidate division WWE3 bacterium CG08_land_8_20_14_0_20_41_15]